MQQNYKKIYEFLLWDNCNNNCSFCFQRESPRLFNKEKRKFILDEVISFINSNKFVKGSHILICGGEIFDKSNDFDILIPFFTTLCNYMNEGIIDLLYLNTNLIYSDLKPLITVLNLINDNKLFDRLKFTTSYDLKGRFKKKEDEELMLSNLDFIMTTYSECKTVVNTILTKQVCEAILDDSFNLNSFMNKYRCWINLIPYIVLDKELMGTRQQIFKALKKVDDIVPGYLEKYIPNMSIEQEKLLYMYKDNAFQFCSCKIAECGHSINFKRYSDKGTCFCCDLKEIFKGYI